MISNLYVRLELHFWDVVIPMLSKSQTLRTILPYFNTLASPQFQRWLGIRSAIVIASGFLTGLAFYVVTLLSL